MTTPDATTTYDGTGNVVHTNGPDWAALTAPFPPDEVEKLPKILSRDDKNRGNCREGSNVSADGHYCGGYHARAIHLDYVGHAGITMRLNSVCGPDGWSWRPMSLTPEGLPMIGAEFWIVLNVWGVEKFGVGDDYGRSSKQAIGDALRNAAMRFGIGTYLWSKSEASNLMAESQGHQETDTATVQQMANQLWSEAQQTTMFDEVRAIWARANAAGVLAAEVEQMDGPPEPLGDALRRYGDALQTTGA